MIKQLTSLPQQGTTDDGIIVRLCPINKTKGKPIYCSRNGEFFSYRLIRDRRTGLARYHFCQLQPQWYRGFKRTNNVHSAYPYIGSSRGTTCHMLMALTWLGSRPAGCECDHINGNILDWRADNLEWVTPAENRRRSKVLKALRSIDIDPVQVPYNILDIFLNPKIISDMSVLTTRLTKLRDLLSPLFGGVFTPNDFKRWLMMPQDEFDQMISKYHRDPRSTDEIMQYEMSHHMEI